MNRKKIALGIGIVLVVLAAFTAPAAAGPNTVYFVPQHSSAGPDETTYVEVWFNLTDWYGDDPEYGFSILGVNITWDPSVADIISCDEPDEHPWDAGWTKHKWGNSWYMILEHNPWTDTEPPYGLDPGVYPVANLTIKGISPGVTDLAFSHEIPRYCEMVDAIGDPMPNQSWVDGTFTCTAPQETYSKELVEGWNLISLPLTADDMTVASVFSSVAGKYDALYSYDAETHSWVALGDDDTLENGVGYFIHMTESGTWTYQGSAYTTMSISLEPGLNMVGWLNCSKPIDDALSSIEGNYRYVARWNSTAHKFEVYVPGAPSEFNDFNTMERGEGYFISMKTSDTLTASC